MTDNEIIKALECCVKDDGTYCDCDNCKYCTDTYFCNRCELWEDVFDLINHKNEEISKKDIEIDILIQKKEDLSDEVSDLRAEVERLTKCRKEEVEKFMLATDRVITEAKSEAYKEFAERLRKNSILCSGCVPWYDIHETIDNTLKELTEKGR